MFADPDFDGDPVQIYEPDANDPPVPPDDEDGEDDDAGTGPDSTDDPPDDDVDGDGEADFPPLPPDIDIPPGDPPPRRTKYFVGDVPVFVVGRTGAVLRQGRPPDHRIFEGLHPKDGAQRLRLTRRLPGELEYGGPEGRDY